MTKNDGGWQKLDGDRLWAANFGRENPESPEDVKKASIDILRAQGASDEDILAAEQMLLWENPDEPKPEPENTFSNMTMDQMMKLVQSRLWSVGRAIDGGKS